MRILHVVPYYLPAVRYGGPIVSVHGLCKGLYRRGHDVHVFTTNVDGSRDSRVPLAVPVDVDGVKVWYFPSKYLRGIYLAPRMARALADNIGHFDVAHLHSIFQWPTLAAARIARRAELPYIVAPRGMLEKELLRRKSRIAKSAWIALFGKNNLENAAAIHATSAREVVEAKAFGFQLPPIFVVPNGVDLEGPVDSSAAVSPTVSALIERGPYLLFLGRINWKKGLDRLIKSLRYLPSAFLVVAGNDEENYRPVLEALTKTQGVSGQVVFTGPVHGANKAALLRHAYALVLPSYSENFGNVVLEAMAAGCPAVVTPEVGAAVIVEETKGGVVTEGAAEPLADAIRRLLADTALRDEMGSRGRKAVRARYTWDLVAGQMLDEYQKVIKQKQGGQGHERL